MAAYSAVRIALISLAVLVAATADRAGATGLSPTATTLHDPDCLREARAACGHIVLAQARTVRVRAATAAARRSVTIAIRITADSVTQSVTRIGVTVRSAAKGVRQDIQRYFVDVVCCKQRIRANAIADDLSQRFPSARIERSVQVHRQRAASKERPDNSEKDGFNPVDVIDFLVFDREGPKLVFEGCAEIQNDKSLRNLPPDQRHYVVIDNAPRPIDLSRIEKVQACVNFSTGEVTYQGFRGTVSVAPPPANELGRVEVLDGDTIRVASQTYRLVGFDAPESAARCETERDLANRATRRLRDLVVGGGLTLERVPCACPPGTEGTQRCNFGRLCGVLKTRGRDVSAILIAEGLARAYACGKTDCPKRQGWCG